MTTLVERLRAFIKDDYAVERPQMRALCTEAADEIERLRALLRDLRDDPRIGELYARIDAALKEEP
jgi:GrpB-like predicted nucleotidyltransferase (UPF0157 family)